MPDNDFDIDSLATFLHVTPAQIEKMASRGKLPGRKIAGKWRFSKAEIHLWFEEKIGVASEGDLLEYQQMLERSTSDSELQIPMLLPAQNILVPLLGRTKNSVIEKICNFASDLGLLWDPGKMAEAIRARESMHTTALENGVALLHPRRPLPNLMGEPFLILAKTLSGIPFGGLRGSLTDVFFLIASVDDAGHLRTLTLLSRLISDSKVLSAIRELDSPAEIFEMMQAAESELRDQG